jgi:hypothetical protein
LVTLLKSDESVSEPRKEAKSTCNNNIIHLVDAVGSIFNESLLVHEAAKNYQELIF